jgi:preprotein translocase subunit SecA
VIIAQAGQPGAVTIATNMAGRGVDIKLGGDPEGVARERLRREDFDLTEISQTHWNRAVEALREGREIDHKDNGPWIDVLAEAVADCQQDRQRVLRLGGLHVLGTERHEARRIDNQLRGRSGRQGDPGSSRFYISLEDELMRRFGGERIKSLMDRFGMEKDVPLEHAWLDKSIESAQTRVEGYNFDIRKHVLEFDDVVNKQREVIYKQRRQVLEARDLRDQVLRMARDEISSVVDIHTSGPDPDQWDLHALDGELRTFFPLPQDFDYERWSNLTPSEIKADLFEKAESAYERINRELGHLIYEHAARENLTLEMLAASSDPPQRMVYEQIIESLDYEPDEDLLETPLDELPNELRERIEETFVYVYRLFRDRQMVLQAVDSLWVRHLTNLDALREGIGLRAYGQQNPLVAYRKEAHEMYQNLLGRIQRRVARSIYLLPKELRSKPRRQQLRASRRRPVQLPSNKRAPQQQPQLQTTTPTPSSSNDVRPDCDLGRNDPCWCGSGKKYKHCHLRKDKAARRAQRASRRR